MLAVVRRDDTSAASGNARSGLERLLSFCRKLRVFPRTGRKIGADFVVECLPDRSRKRRQIAVFGLTRVDRVEPRCAVTFDTVPPEIFDRSDSGYGVGGYREREEF